MSQLRLFFLWLIVAAIPLQGLAAASMLFCGTGTHHAPAQITVALQQKIANIGGPVERHDHSKHGHAGGIKAEKSAETGGKALPDAAHKCGVCASCCTSVAITELRQLVALAPVPQTVAIEPFVLLQARPSSVPDKPPRA